ncbi:MAG TPA: hypothetical protein VGC29_06480 [Flavisolibacter sp.]
MMIYIISIALAISTLVAWMQFMRIRSLRNRKASLRFIRQFNRLGAQHNISFTSQEILKGTIIGIDGLHRKLLILRKRKFDNSVSTLIDLNEIRHCSILMTFYPAPATSRRRRVKKLVEKIALCVELNDNTVEEILFYHHRHNPVTEITAMANKAKDWEVILTKMHIPVKKIA